MSPSLIRPERIAALTSPEPVLQLPPNLRRPAEFSRCVDSESDVDATLVAPAHLIERLHATKHPGVVFERYADDVLAHCAIRAQAQVVLAGRRQRLRELGMAVHPSKTRIVYCRDGKRQIGRASCRER